MVEQRGIEPLTSALRTRRSAKLSYCPTTNKRIQFRVSSFKESNADWTKDTAKTKARLQVSGKRPSGKMPRNLTEERGQESLNRNLRTPQQLRFRPTFQVVNEFTRGLVLLCRQGEHGFPRVLCFALPAERGGRLHDRIKGDRIVVKRRRYVT